MCAAMVRSKHRIFGGNPTFVTGALHKHTLPIDISCCEDIRHIALQVVIHRDITPICQHTGYIEIEIVYISWPASRKEDCSYFEAMELLALTIVQSDTSIGLFKALGSGLCN